MADATLQILGLGTSSVPQDYTVKGGQVIGLSAVRAIFDGSGAATAFLPAVEVLSTAGVVMSRTLSDSVAAGSSADVTFHPFRKKATSAATVNQPLWDVMWSNGFGNNVFQDATGSLDNVAWFNALGESYNGVTSLIDVDPAPDNSFVYYPQSHVPLAYLLEMSFFMPADPQVPPPPVAKVWDIQADLYRGDLGAWSHIGSLIPAAGFSYWADSDFVWVARTGNQYSAEETASLNVVVKEPFANPKYAVQVVLYQSFPTGNPLTDFQPLPGARFKLTELYAPTFPPV